MGVRYPEGYAVMLARFVEWRSKHSRYSPMCFTYESLFNWVSRQLEYRDIARTTLERVVRRLAEDGYLKRVRERPRAIFCVTPKLIELARRVSGKRIEILEWEEPE